MGPGPAVGPGMPAPMPGINLEPVIGMIFNPLVDSCCVLFW